MSHAPCLLAQASGVHRHMIFSISPEKASQFEGLTDGRSTGTCIKVTGDSGSGSRSCEGLHVAYNAPPTALVWWRLHLAGAASLSSIATVAKDGR
eukprot:COSAG02_NODE_1971_length_10222_cov_11.455399_1_plen_95_part_00